MPMTVLARHRGSNFKGKRRHLWIPNDLMPDGVLDTAALTATGTVDVTNNLVVAPVFTPSQAQEPDGDVGTLVVGKVAGDVTFPDATAQFRLHPSGPENDIRAVLHEGDEGFWVVANEGLVAGLSADVVTASIGYGGKTGETVGYIEFPIIASFVEQDVTIPALA